MSEKLTSLYLRKVAVIAGIVLVAIIFAIRFVVDLAFEDETTGLRRSIALIASGLIILPAAGCAYAYWGRERFLRLFAECRTMFRRSHAAAGKGHSQAK